MEQRALLFSRRYVSTAERSGCCGAAVTEAESRLLLSAAATAEAGALTLAAAVGGAAVLLSLPPAPVPAGAVAALELIAT
jgi:hypothetical protein